MLTCACGAPSAGLGNGDLVDLIESIRSMSSQEAGEAWCECDAGHNRSTALASQFVEFEQSIDIFGRITDRHNAHATSHQRLGKGGVGSARAGEHDHIDLSNNLADIDARTTGVDC